MKLSVHLVDDVAPMLELLRTTLEGIENVEITGTAANAWEARLILRRERPQVVFLDEVLPGESAYDLIPEYLESGVQVVLITGMSNPTHEVPEGVLGRIKKPEWKTLANDRKRFVDILRPLQSKG